MKRRVVHTTTKCSCRLKQRCSTSSNVVVNGGNFVGGGGSFSQVYNESSPAKLHTGVQSSERATKKLAPKCAWKSPGATPLKKKLSHKERLSVFWMNIILLIIFLLLTCAPNDSWKMCCKRTFVKEVWLHFTALDNYTILWPCFTLFFSLQK